MLYALHELQSALASPWRASARAWLEWSDSSSNPFNGWPGNEVLSAASDLALRLTQQYPKQPFGIHAVEKDSKSYVVSEAVVVDKPFCELRHFSKLNCKNPGPTLLLVAPLSGHHATLLRDTVRTFLQDYDVYITDWKDARNVPLAQGTFGFDDYVSYVKSFLHHFDERIFVVSVCQPTVPVMCAVSLMSAAKDPKRPRAMIMMGGPIDTRFNPSQVNEFAKKNTLDWFKQNLIANVPSQYAGAGRRVYPGFLQYYGFVAMNPDRHANAHWNYFKHLIVGDDDSVEQHRKFYDEYNAVLDLPAEYYLETVERVFQDHHLPLGKMRVAGQTVDPAAIRDVRLMSVEGELDDISCPGQTAAALLLCRNIPTAQKTKFIAPKVGHYGIFSGSKFRSLVYPKMRDFLGRK
jgi:poly(3-hydroxybutyrate) depolymerase